MRNKTDKNSAYKFYFSGKILFTCVLFFFSVINLHSQWIPAGSPSGGYIQNLVSFNGNIYANAINSGIYKSTSPDYVWQLTSPRNHPLRETQVIFADNSVIYAATIRDGYFKSTDNGSSWVKIRNGTGTGGKPLFTNNIKKYRNGIAFCTDDGIYITNDQGDTWIPLLTEINMNVIDIAEVNETTYIIDINGFLLVSPNGTQWNRLTFPNSPNLEFYKLFRDDNSLFFCVHDSLGFSGYNYNIFRKFDYEDTLRLYNPQDFQNRYIINTSQKGLDFAVSTYRIQDNAIDYNVFVSNDEGLKWNSVFDTTMYYKLMLSPALTLEGNYVFAGTYFDGIIRINVTNGQKTFQSNNIHNLMITSLAFRGNDFYAGTALTGIYYSGNSGLGWQQLKESPKQNSEEYLQIFKIGFLNETVIAATRQGFHKSTDKGESWQSMGLSDYVIIDMYIEGNQIFAAGNVFTGSVFISTDSGNSWTTRQLPDESVIQGFYKDGNNFLAVTNHGIYRSTNMGNNWSKVFSDLPATSGLQRIIRSGNNLLSTSSEGVYISGNNGFSWFKADNTLSNSNIIDLRTFGNYVFCSTDSSVYISMDNGSNWEDVSKGLGNKPIRGFASRQNDIYSYSFYDAIFRTNLQTLSKIKISPLNENIFCNDYEFVINYTLDSDIEFSSDNFFIAELSNSSGSFVDNTIIIGTIQSTNSGIISAKIPSDITFGTNYRIRIRSTSPEYIGIDNLANLIILERSIPQITGENSVCLGDTTVFSTEFKSGFTYKWEVENGEIIGNDNNSTVSIVWSNPGSGSLKILQQSISACSDSNSFSVIINPAPEKPVITEIDSMLISSAAIGNQWYLDGDIISGATQQSIRPEQDGYYTVQVVNEWGCKSEVSDEYAYIKFEDKLVISIDDAEATDGEIVRINVRLLKNLKFYELDVRSIRANLVFNASLLYPLSDDKGVIIDGKRYIQITLDTNYINQDIIKVLEFTAMLGNAESTYLEFENIFINELPEKDVVINSGKFSLLDLCYEGGVRLVTSMQSASIISFSPNPALDKISFAVRATEPANGRIYFLNSAGVIEAEIYNGLLSDGISEFSYPLNNFSSGDYLLVLESNGGKSVQKIIIAR